MPGTAGKDGVGGPGVGMAWAGKERVVNGVGVAVHGPAPGVGVGREGKDWVGESCEGAVDGAWQKRTGRGSRWHLGERGNGGVWACLREVGGWSVRCGWA